MPHLTLTLLPESFKILQFPPETPLPVFPKGSFVTLTVSEDEITLVCPESVALEAPQASTGWRCFKFEGPFAFDQTGILNSITGPLADTQVGIFAISTFNTDYLLVKAHQLDTTLEALKAAGHQIQGA